MSLLAEEKIAFSYLIWYKEHYLIMHLRYYLEIREWNFLTHTLSLIKWRVIVKKWE